MFDVRTVHVRCSRNDHQYDCTTPLFYVLAPTCFGSSLPLSGSFLDPSELPEIQIKWVVYHIMCGYVACGYICMYVCMYVCMPVRVAARSKT
jgi:hypothetical protein